MILDENSARLLVSEALKDKLSVSDSDDLASDDESLELLTEIFVESDNQKFSISGVLTNFLRDANDSNIELQNRISIADAHEIFSLIDGKKNAVCPRYTLALFNKSYGSDGPFKISLKNITSINYKTGQCTICFELVRLKR